MLTTVGAKGHCACSELNAVEVITNIKMMTNRNKLILFFDINTFICVTKLH